MDEKRKELCKLTGVTKNYLEHLIFYGKKSDQQIFELWVNFKQSPLLDDTNKFIIKVNFLIQKNNRFPYYLNFLTELEKTIGNDQLL